MIAILVAVRQELTPILRRAKANQVVRQAHLDFHEGTLAGQPVALLALGVGKECARIAAEMTIRCYRPDLIVSAGFGGGLSDTVGSGDIVVGTEIFELAEDYRRQLRWVSAHKPIKPPTFESMPAGLHVHHGKILTADEMVLKADAKKRLGAATGALTVDMETSAVATVAAAHDTDFLAVRCISDTARDNLPEEFNDFFVLGQLRSSRIISSCARRPHIVLELARLGYRAYHSGRNLARFLEAAVSQLHIPDLATRNL
jgi:adenosylhomocysteine nucleosidase